MFLKKKNRAINFATMNRLMHDVLNVLDGLGIKYHLEGGTLLGIVRDGDLLPWDHDADVSIMREDVGHARAIIWALRRKGWRLSIRRYDRDHIYAKKGEIRLIKVKGRRFFFFPDQHMLDIFIKTRHDGFVYWEAMRCTMRVPQDHFDGQTPVDWKGRTVFAPLRHEDYLAAKYGNWQVPVKDWQTTNEGTIVERMSRRP